MPEVLIFLTAAQWPWQKVHNGLVLYSAKNFEPEFHNPPAPLTPGSKQTGWKNKSAIWPGSAENFYSLIAVLQQPGQLLLLLFLGLNNLFRLRALRISLSAATISSG